MNNSNIFGSHSSSLYFEAANDLSFPVLCSMLNNIILSSHSMLNNLCSWYIVTMSCLKHTCCRVGRVARSRCRVAKPCLHHDDDNVRTGRHSWLSHCVGSHPSPPLTTHVCHKCYFWHHSCRGDAAYGWHHDTRNNTTGKLCHWQTDKSPPSPPNSLCLLAVSRGGVSCVFLKIRLWIYFFPDLYTTSELLLLWSDFS
jgi:hypothetical protein